MEARRRYGITGMAEKVSGKDSGGKSRWWRCGKIGIDTAAEEIQDSNIRDVGLHRWQNGLEEQRRNGKILTGNDYQPEVVLFL